MQLPFPLGLTTPAVLVLSLGIVMGELARLHLAHAPGAVTAVEVTRMLLLFGVVAWTRQRLAPALAARPYTTAAGFGFLVGVGTALMLLAARSAGTNRVLTEPTNVLRYLASMGLGLSCLLVLLLGIARSWHAFIAPATRDDRSGGGAV